MYYIVNNELYHYGIMGQKWGVRRFQNPDGTLTAEGKKRYGSIADYAAAKPRTTTYERHMAASEKALMKRVEKNKEKAKNATDAEKRSKYEFNAAKNQAKVNQLIKKAEKFYSLSDIEQKNIDRLYNAPFVAQFLVGPIAAIPTYMITNSVIEKKLS